LNWIKSFLKTSTNKMYCHRFITHTDKGSIPPEGGGELDPDPHPHQSKKQDPDLDQSER
jgi:hypothetical protein